LFNGSAKFDVARGRDFAVLEETQNAADPSEVLHGLTLFVALRGVRCRAAITEHRAASASEVRTARRLWRGARFDHQYYRDKHMPLLKARMGDACKHYTLDKGVAGGTPGAPASYVGMCHIFCDSIEAFQAGFGPHAMEIMADIRNYSDQSPVIQINEVVVG
jgi:uncharacterized protein (TIGR02118 family)